MRYTGPNLVTIHPLPRGGTDLLTPEASVLSGSFNMMVSHRVRLSGKEDIDKELLGWLREAYDNA